MFLIDGGFFDGFDFYFFGEQVSNLISGDEVAKLGDEEDAPYKGGLDEKR